jgi:hypothetical protein
MRFTTSKKRLAQRQPHKAPQAAACPDAGASAASGSRGHAALIQNPRSARRDHFLMILARGSELDAVPVGLNAPPSAPKVKTDGRSPHKPTATPLPSNTHASAYAPSRPSSPAISLGRCRLAGTHHTQKPCDWTPASVAVGRWNKRRFLLSRSTALITPGSLAVDLPRPGAAGLAGNLERPLTNAAPLARCAKESDIRGFSPAPVAKESDCDAPFAGARIDAYSLGLAARFALAPTSFVSSAAVLPTGAPA